MATNELQRLLRRREEKRREEERGEGKERKLFAFLVLFIKHFIHLATNIESTSVGLKLKGHTHNCHWWTIHGQLQTRDETTMRINTHTSTA
ncbi:unnamed protein product [Brugia pahangi]|uniref:Uncharacterized protein n=1 Tax=Brugia pahangi TaxID=6280 RepID=A0A0N4TRQ9_BRUPA|nr:unnamed protein product [Brugia pahangi]